MQAETRMIWLKLASATVIAFGLLFFLSTLPPLSAPMAFLFDLVIWPLDGGEDLAVPASQLLLAISGGVMAGWGAMLWLITTRLYPSDPKLARSLILTSVCTWFVVDSLGSVIAGAPLNVLFNIVFLELFVIPLWRLPDAAEPPMTTGMRTET